MISGNEILLVFEDEIETESGKKRMHPAFSRPLDFPFT